MSNTPPDQAPIIIVKKVKGHGGHHGGAWKVAYADFVTAMMALFIVLWLLASNEEVKKAVGGYFQDPTGQGKMQGSTKAGMGDALSVGKDDMSKLKEKIEQAIGELPQLKQIEKNVQMTVTNEGLRIELLEKEGGLWFESGSSKMSTQGIEVVAMLGEQLKSLKNRLVVEGHTDAKPYSVDKGYTNWELSADRANMARRLLLESGVPIGQVVQIRGFADQQLRNKQNPLDPANRRVSVIVLYSDAKAAETPASSGGSGQAPKAAPAEAGHSGPASPASKGH